MSKPRNFKKTKTVKTFEIKKAPLEKEVIIKEIQSSKKKPRQRKPKKAGNSDHNQNRQAQPHKKDPSKMALHPCPSTIFRPDRSTCTNYLYNQPQAINKIRQTIMFSPLTSNYGQLVAIFPDGICAGATLGLATTTQNPWVQMFQNATFPATAIDLATAAPNATYAGPLAGQINATASSRLMDNVVWTSCSAVLRNTTQGISRGGTIQSFSTPIAHEPAVTWKAGELQVGSSFMSRFASSATVACDSSGRNSASCNALIDVESYNSLFPYDCSSTVCTLGQPIISSFMGFIITQPTDQQSYTLDIDITYSYVPTAANQLVVPTNRVTHTRSQHSNLLGSLAARCISQSETFAAFSGDVLESRIKALMRDALIRDALGAFVMMS